MKIGVRVRVYQGNHNQVGTITHAYDNGTIYVHFDEGEFMLGESGVIVHPRQCRKIKPKHDSTIMIGVAGEEIKKGQMCTVNYGNGLVFVLARK